MAAAMVLGENIGTTIGANLVASRAGVQASRAALAHFIFNVLGAAFVLIFFNIFIKINLWLVSLFGLDAQMTSVFGVACVHTLFNVTATVVLVWFRKPFADFLARCIKEPAPKKGDFRLRFIGSGRLHRHAVHLDRAGVQGDGQFRRERTGGFSIRQTCSE